MKTPTLWRLSAAIGVAGSLVIGLGSLAMAAPIQVGTLSFTTVGAPAGDVAATWTWPAANHGLGATPTPSGPVTLYGWPGATAPGTYAASFVLGTGQITPGPSTTSVTIDFTKLTNWPDVHEEFQMTTQGGPPSQPFQFDSAPFGQLPEVPWAAALPLLMVLPWGVYAVKQRRQARS